MRVLHISSEATWRGGEQQIAYLIKELENKGVKNLALCKKDSSFSTWCRENEVEYTEARFKNSTDLSTAKAIKRVAEERDAQLIHLHSGKGHGLYALSTLLGNKKVAILSRRVDFPIKKNVWARWKYNLPQIKRILCVSDAIKAMMQEGVKDASKCSTIHSGIDLSRFLGVLQVDLREEFGIGEDKVLIGNVAALAPHKDYGTFIDTVQLCADRGLKVHFLIIGEGSEREMIEERIRIQGLGSYITLTGFRNDVPSVLSALDIFLISSETEGLGTSILDAFASGLPVVATAAGGIPELVLHEHTGLLCPVKSPDCLADSVQRLIENQELMKQLAESASQHLKSFTKEEVADKTLKVYKEVLAS